MAGLLVLPVAQGFWLFRVNVLRRTASAKPQRAVARAVAR
jgi:hypothetical protein